MQKVKKKLTINLLPRSNEQLSVYSNPDNHPKGAWKATPLHAKSGTNTSSYTFRNGVVWQPPAGTFRRFNDNSMKEMDANNEIWFGSDGKQVPSRKSFLCDVKSGITPVTIWTYDEVGHTHEANNELKTLELNGIFDNPKPSRLIKRILKLTTESDSIVLDFFSGSATTAHAVMQLNAEDGGNRRYICVQLPELCGEKSEAYKAGYKNICEIGKERIRRAGNKILAEWREKRPQMENGENESPVPPDVGFKVFKLDTSNISAWDGYAVRNEGKEGLQKRIDEFLEGVKPGRTRLDVVYEIILKTGFPLTAKVETIDINGREVYSIDNETILICLFENVGFEDVEEMAQYAPAHIVFGEKCFADTSAVKNAKEALRDTGIDIKFF